MLSEPSLSFTGLFLSGFLLALACLSAAMVRYNRLLRKRYMPQPFRRKPEQAARLVTGPAAALQELPPIVTVIVHGAVARPWLNFTDGCPDRPLLQAGGQTMDSLEQRWQSLTRPGERSLESAGPAIPVQQSAWQSSFHSSIPLELS